MCERPTWLLCACVSKRARNEALPHLREILFVFIFAMRFSVCVRVSQCGAQGFVSCSLPSCISLALTFLLLSLCFLFFWSLCGVLRVIWCACPRLKLSYIALRCTLTSYVGRPRFLCSLPHLVSVCFTVILCFQFASRQVSVLFFSRRFFLRILFCHLTDFLFVSLCQRSPTASTSSAAPFFFSLVTSGFSLEEEGG